MSFDARAKEWDKKDMRVQGAKIIADAIMQQIPLHKKMELLDFGVGTGLLGFTLAPHVKQVYGVDTSAGMIKTLEEKNTKDLFIKPIHQDIIAQPLEQSFDGVVSSMTLHHIEDLEKFFTQIYKNTKNGGFLAIADLTKEDGTFHSDNTGVYHFGFEKESLGDIVKRCGFKDIRFDIINTITKPHKNFDIFLLTASKKED